MQPMQADPSDFFFEWLAQHPRSCPNCRYQLAGLTRPVCPECGVELILRVRAAESRGLAHLLGLVGLSTGLGFGGILSLLTFIFVLVGVLGPSDPDARRMVLRGGCGAVLFTIAILIWHKKRHTIRRLSTPRRFALAASMWCLSAAYILFIAMTTNF